MSGHSKWSTIKRKKGALDAQKGKAFTKLSQIITIATQNGGGDPSTNFALRLAMEKAKRMNMPKDNIARAINKAIGKDSGKFKIEEIIYEGSGKNGVAVIVDTTTDNKNRTAAEVRRIFESHGGSLGPQGSVMWQFEEKGVIKLKCSKLIKSEKFGEPDKEHPIDKDEVMLEIFDIDNVEDVKEIQLDGNATGAGKCKGLEVYCQKNALYSVQMKIINNGYVVVSAEIVKIPKNMLSVDAETKESIRKLKTELENNDDIQNVWVNIDLK